MVDQYRSFEGLQTVRGVEVLVAWKVLDHRRQMEGLGHMVFSVTSLEASSQDQADTSDSRKEGDEEAIEELLASEVEGL
jgi:hypothetical protein